MLDEQNTPDPKPDAELDAGQDTQPGAEGQDTLAAEEPELVVTIDGEEPDADPDAAAEAELGEAGKRALARAREAAKENAAKARKAEAELERIRQSQVPKVETVKKPTMEECGFDEDTYAERMAAYVEAQAKVKAEEAKARAAEEAAKADYDARFAGYAEAKAKLPPSDFEAAEEAVKASLSVQQQAIIVRNAANPAQVVLALGKSPKALAALAAEKDYDRFAYKLAQTEGKITVTTKPKPQAETVLRGGAAGAGGMSLSKQLELAEKEADRTGDRTQVQRIKREMKAAGAA
jgi:hypothetical protein